MFLGRISTGAMNDLERITKQAYAMIAYFGMSENLANLCYYNNNEYSFSKPYSESTAEKIDEEVKLLINTQYERAKELLIKHKEQHNKLAQELMDREVILAEDVEAIFGKRKWKSRSEEIMEVQQKAKLKEEEEKEKKKHESEEAEALAQNSASQPESETKSEETTSPTETEDSQANSNS